MTNSERPDTSGYVLQIHVPSGVAGGPSVISKDSWNGEGALFSPSTYSDFRKSFNFGRTGVYILWNSEGEWPLVYVGEAEDLQDRLDVQLKEKDWCANAVAFCSSDKSLNKAHVRHIESQLIQLAREAKRCDLDNKQGTVSRDSTLPLSDKVKAENYLSNMLLCLPVLGVDFFERSAERHPESELLFINVRGVQASGYEGVSSFVVKADSQATKEETPSVRDSSAKHRQSLLENGVLQDDGASYYKFVQDYSFPSPNKAAAVVLGSKRNALTVWKDANGRTLKKIRKEQLESN